MRIAITGATGYIGQTLSSLARKRGHAVVALSRHKLDSLEDQWIPFDLSSTKHLELPSGTGAVIHLAANTSNDSALNENSETMAAQRLNNAANNIGAKFIFVSSQTASPTAPTPYGRTKWRIEQEVISAGGWAVRPGLVYGGKLSGLFGTLVGAVKRLPLLPAFLPAPKIQPIHVDDLAEGLLRIAERSDLDPGVFSLGPPEPVSFSTFLGEIAISRLRVFRGFAPVPVMAINALAGILGEPLGTRLGLARMQSLFKLPVMDTASDLERIGLTLRPLHSGMTPSGDDRRRRLLLEGRAMLAYVLKDAPSSALLRRYTRAIERLRGAQALDLPQIFLSYPIFMSLIDHSSWSAQADGTEFSWRLDAATVLAEATPSGANRFLDIGHERGSLGSLLSITVAVTLEAFWRILKVAFSPFVRLAISHSGRAL